MTALNKLAGLREELSNPAIGSNHHLRKLALSLLDDLELALRANASQADHINQQQNRIDQLEGISAKLGKYTGSLESLVVTRTVTVKLPEDRAAESEISGYDGTEFYRSGWNARGKADREALTAAGIQVIEGEGQ